MNIYNGGGEAVKQCSKIAIMSKEKYGHIPVLKEEVIDFLKLKVKDKVVDCTLGLGGHAEAILEKIGPSGKLIGIEQDEENLEIARERLKKYFDQTFLYHANFADLEQVVEKADAILFDLGMASTHVDEPEKGFSFLRDGPLHLKFDRSSKKDAADLVNSLDEKELARIFFRFGEERRASRIAGEIIRERKKEKILRTKKLAEIVERAVGRRGRRHPATKVFQALRIAVNDELNVLQKGLWSAVDILKKGGRVVVISYHSLEDRIVKNIFREAAELKIITKKPIVPSREEIERNPRSRSAKMRVGEKII